MTVVRSTDLPVAGRAKDQRVGGIAEWRLSQKGAAPVVAALRRAGEFGA